MKSEKNCRETGLREWSRIGAAAGAASLLSLSACGAAKTAVHEAENPAAREAATKMMHLGEQTAKDFADSRNMMVPGFTKLDVGNTLSEKIVDNSGTYLVEVEHKPRALDDLELSDEEKDRVECAVDAIVQTPAGVREYVNGTSVWQRGADGQWFETITEENKGGPLDLCKLALSAMPGAGN